MSSRTDFGLIHLVTPPHLLSSCQIPCKGKNVFLAVTHVLTGHKSTPISSSVQGINRGFSSIYLLSGSEFPGTSSPLRPSSCLEIWPKLARDLKSNCRATNRWADWCHEQKKSYSRILTFSLHYITCFWHYLLPEENEPCIFTCATFCYFSMQLSYINADIVIFSSKVKEETCRTISYCF